MRMPQSRKGSKMPAAKEVTKVATTTLKVDKKCKSCVRYRSEDDSDQVTTSLYLQNTAFEVLGKPERITISVSVPS